MEALSVTLTVASCSAVLWASYDLFRVDKLSGVINLCVILIIITCIILIIT